MIWPRQALSGHNLLCSETRRVILQLLPVSRFGLAALEQGEQEGLEQRCADQEADREAGHHDVPAQRRCWM